MAAGAPANSPSRNPSGAAAAKQEASVKPGFQPSAAAQSTASATSSGSMVRTRNESSSIQVRTQGGKTQQSRQRGATSGFAFVHKPCRSPHGIGRIEPTNNPQQSARPGKHTAVRRRPKRNGHLSNKSKFVTLPVGA